MKVLQLILIISFNSAALMSCWSPQTNKIMDDHRNLIFDSLFSDFTLKNSFPIHKSYVPDSIPLHQLFKVKKEILNTNSKLRIQLRTYNPSGSWEHGVLYLYNDSSFNKLLLLFDDYWYWKLSCNKEDVSNKLTFDNNLTEIIRFCYKTRKPEEYFDMEELIDDIMISALHFHKLTYLDTCKMANFTNKFSEDINDSACYNKIRNNIHHINKGLQNKSDEYAVFYYQKKNNSPIMYEIIIPTNYSENVESSIIVKTYNADCFCFQVW